MEGLAVLCDAKVGMKLGFGLRFEDLCEPEGLVNVARAFHAFAQQDTYVAEGLMAEKLLVDAVVLEHFLVHLFCLEEIVAPHKMQHELDSVIYSVKRNFIQKRMHHQVSVENAESKLKSLLGLDEIDDQDYALSVSEWMKDEVSNANKLEIALQYAKDQINVGSERNIFLLPKKVEHERLFAVKSSPLPGGYRAITSIKNVARSGFDLTDNGAKTIEAVSNANYCIYCHVRSKDSCRAGFTSPDGVYKKSALGTSLEGCPLDQKISQMHLLKSHGRDLAALAVVMMDNPMCLATGRRICNDCRLSCIYQKQDPVDTPSVESQIVDSVLSLPYGFEIYSLLAKWNPLAGIIAKSYNGKRVLVVGMGPAGFTMAHYLLNDGCAVIGIDGLKAEPLSSELVTNFAPIEKVTALFEALSERVSYGFGGVAEYGITARWDKNKLTLLRIMLERRHHFRFRGSTSLGCNFSMEQAFDFFGFNHVVLAVGAGKPKVPPIENWTLAGVRMATDFLMSLHINTPYRAESASDLQIRLPVVVIGGGLTAVDAATEALAYYPIQVEKFLARYERLQSLMPEDRLRQIWGNKYLEQVLEFIEHARRIRECREKGLSALPLLKEWGGVKIVYRKRLIDSPAYCINHEELLRAMEEGIEFIEGLSPIKCIGAESVEQLECNGKNGEILVIDARTVLIAVGALHNDNVRSYIGDNRVSVFGDADPKYSGSVVRAIASVKNGYKDMLARMGQGSCSDFASFAEMFERFNASTVVGVNRLTPTIVEVVIHAPIAARNFMPGQFYRLQTKSIEPLALTGADVQGDNVHLVVLEMGGSSSLCQFLKPGEAVSLMGPCGHPTEIPVAKTVLLVGGGLGNAVLFSIGKAMRKKGCKVLYCAVYRKESDRFKVADLEEASDSIIWGCDSGKLEVTRASDRSFSGNVIEVLLNYAQACKHDPELINFADVDHVMVIGSSGMMEACARALKGILSGFFKKSFSAIAVLNAPMQCMMKGVCARCLQHMHYKDGGDEVIFSCIAQDQPIEYIDFDCLHNRLSQDHTLESLTHLWLAKGKLV